MKRCPFCSGTVLGCFHDTFDGYAVFCHTCRTDGPVCDTYDKAVAKWNKRDIDELLRTADQDINMWLSAALSDVLACEDFKVDIRKWLELVAKHHKQGETE